jgi:sRNA-binding carbon storage regulator CsrA
MHVGPRKPGLGVTRRPGESLEMILPDGRRIVVTAGQVKGRTMRWHVIAPDDVKLLRSETRPRTTAV